MSWSTQRNWRLCTKCQGLWFAGNPNQSACPAGGSHAQNGSANYSLLLDATSAPGQSGWRHCAKCHGLWFSGALVAGTCPLGGTHAVSGGNYTLAMSGSGQPGWFCCSRCSGLWFTGAMLPGVCAAGGPHDPTGSADFTLVRVTSAVRVHTKILVAPSRATVETMLQNMREIYADAKIDVEWVSSEPLSLVALEDVEIGTCTLGGVPTTEQTQLHSHRNGAGSNDIVVYFVRSTNPPANGCAVHPAGQPGAVVARDATQWTLAHEVGHVLELPHSTSRNRLMYEATVDITNPPPDLDTSEITKMNASPLTVNV